jgi:hypothetical protein
VICCGELADLLGGEQVFYCHRIEVMFLYRQSTPQERKNAAPVFFFDVREAGKNNLTSPKLYA